MSDVLSKCAVCQALLDEEDLFCGNCGAEAPRRDDATAVKPSRMSTHQFECNGCGAAMSYDASAGRLRCPFCGSERLEQRESKRVLTPSRVVPFSIDKETAVATMRAWLTGGIWRPSDLSHQAVVVTMSAVYVPYWVFEATTHTYWTADSDQVPHGGQGEWYPMTGEHHGRYDSLLVGASGVLTAHETSEVCPFDLTAGVSVDQCDFDNVTVEEFSVPRKYARPQARNDLEARELDTCRQQYVPGRCRNLKVDVLLEGMSSEPVVLPLWMLAYRYREKTYGFLMNGQSGKCTGTAPVTYAKVGIIAGLIALTVLLLLGLLGLVSR
jgi:hypothetical protein